MELVYPEEAAVPILKRDELGARLGEGAKAGLVIPDLTERLLALGHIEAEATRTDELSGVVVEWDVVRLEHHAFGVDETAGPLAVERATNRIDHLGMVVPDLSNIPPVELTGEPSAARKNPVAMAPEEPVEIDGEGEGGKRVRKAAGLPMLRVAIRIDTRGCRVISHHV
jgi:hypothetical protein